MSNFKTDVQLLADLQSLINEADKTANMDTTTSGIVSIEHSVDKATRLTESRASCPYRVANMVVAAAAGALAAITQAVRSAPRMPQR